MELSLSSVEPRAIKTVKTEYDIRSDVEYRKDVISVFFERALERIFS